MLCFSCQFIGVFFLTLLIELPLPTCGGTGKAKADHLMKADFVKAKFLGFFMYWTRAMITNRLSIVHSCNIKKQKVSGLRRKQKRNPNSWFSSQGFEQTKQKGKNHLQQQQKWPQLAKKSRIIKCCCVLLLFPPGTSHFARNKIQVCSNWNCSPNFDITSFME